MKLTKDMKILIVGLGLIGGSYAKALTKKGYTVSAITKEQSSVDFALQNGYVAKATTIVDKNYIEEADLIVFALYPHTFVEWIRQYKDLIRPGTVLTDVTGIKGSVVSEVQALLPSYIEFIPAHPMAGREVSGVENADERIFIDSNYIVTPTEKNTDGAIELCLDLGRELGFSKLSTLPAQMHDEIIGFVSQLTHCIAICLMTCQTVDGLEKYTGDSFRDLTRIARLNDEMWSELFLTNKTALLKQLHLFGNEMEKMCKIIENDDREALREMMRYSTKRRELFDKRKQEN
ncbi:MAG: prephenate dehydrogenase [Clostridia bacterium]|nr:prephenate dehydrogenase [Clostridia bacterium]